MRGCLDRLLFRRPFEGAGAVRYAAARPAFGDLDDRLLDHLPLSQAATLLDLGSGPATFAARARARHPHLAVIAVEPSRDFARTSPGIHVVRARGEALPLASGSIDVAVCVSSIRHVADRARTLRELRRVVRGSLLIVELDPASDAGRIATHARALGPLLRHTFGPLVVRTAPPAEAIISLAREAGFSLTSHRNDPSQPVYILALH